MAAWAASHGAVKEACTGAHAKQATTVISRRTTTAVGRDMDRSLLTRSLLILMALLGLSAKATAIQL